MKITIERDNLWRLLHQTIDALIFGYSVTIEQHELSSGTTASTEEIVKSLGVKIE